MVNKGNLKIEIGKRVKEIRENKMHMNKVQFAQLIGMKNQYLGTVENGQRGLTIEKVIEICSKCGVSTDYLLYGTDNSIQAYASELLSKYSNSDILKAFEIMKDFSILIK